ncbi:MAG: 3-deoxy-7-phosphoheptulonate synthase [Fimbriimonadaceae bacterium]|nr:3-deoxy-7-phosphoheptulonate synthase [Fimbriimonadaceae bacterium]QYK57490.1 MAG: 3-deoxy-7-phosphoheptulonate synthase [Fimbriimonadaceae bacterium]
MIVVMRPGCAQKDVAHVSEELERHGYTVKPIIGVEKSIVCAVGGEEHKNIDFLEQLRAFDGVEDVLLITKPYKFVARETRPERSVVNVGGVLVGGNEVVMMAGPCTVESEEQVMETAAAVAGAGAKILRGGAFKPSTSPYSFQGMGKTGLEILREAGRRYDLRVVTEVMDPRKVEMVAAYADVLQVGARNMQNYDLLREVGQSRTPVLLKRGLSAKYEELLLAAEYIATGGNEAIMLCERGIRTFETHTRNTLDIGAVPVLRGLSHLPVVVDPSQGTGKRDLVSALSMAAVAAGADSLIIEVHPNPDAALKDGPQSLTIQGYLDMVPNLARIAEAVGRTMAVGSLV